MIIFYSSKITNPALKHGQTTMGGAFKTKVLKAVLDNSVYRIKAEEAMRGP
jgi:hypothetical protein